MIFLERDIVESVMKFVDIDDTISLRSLNRQMRETISPDPQDHISFLKPQRKQNVFGLIALSFARKKECMICGLKTPSGFWYGLYGHRHCIRKNMTFVNNHLSIKYLNLPHFYHRHKDQYFMHKETNKYIPKSMTYNERKKEILKLDVSLKPQLKPKKSQLIKNVSRHKNSSNGSQKQNKDPPNRRMRYKNSPKGETNARSALLLKQNKEIKPRNRKSRKKMELLLSRKKSLKKKLGEKGLELRRDSKLCQTYIQENRYIYGKTVQDIVDRMCQMHFLYAFTDYNKRKKGIIEAKRKELKKKMISRDLLLECCQKAEDELVDEMGGWPDDWPWLE